MGPRLLATIAGGADRTAQWAAVALGFSIPLFTALDSLLLLLVVAGWLASGSWRAKWHAVRANRVALAALLLFGLLLLGALYGVRNPGDAAATLRKYQDLVWISILVWVLREPLMRKRALIALAASLAIVLLVSFLMMAQIIPATGMLAGDPDYRVVFKGRQTHGPLMAFGAFLYVHLASEAVSSRTRVMWLTFAVLAVVNCMLVVQGATGYLVLATLALYLGYLGKGWRGLAWAALFGAALVTALVLASGPFQVRVARIQSEIARWQPGVADPASSVGTRLELYRVSAALVRDRPLLGHGTGSYTKAYAVASRRIETPPVRNPHNEYLHMMVQLGLVGLGGLLFLFVTQWRLAPGLATPLEFRLARALVLMMAIGCLFNSWLMDHTEGLFYAWLTGLLFAGVKSQEAGGPS